MKYLYLLLALIIITAICISSLMWWQDRYPGYIEFYNIAYQASNAVGFLRCGGFTLTNFWAPDFTEGVPNTYFPFFQIIELFMLERGAGIYFLTYWLTWLMLPLSFLIMLFFSVRLYGLRAGLYTISLVSLAFLWTDKHLTNPAQSVAMILIMLVFLALVYKRYIAAFILSLCCMASHTLGLIIVPGILLYGIHQRRQRKSVFIMLGIILLLGAFLLGTIFIDNNLRVAMAVKFQALGANIFSRDLKGEIIGSLRTMLDVKNQNHVFLGWLALAGLVICYIRRGKFLILPSIFLAFFPIAWTGDKIRFWGMPAVTIFSLLGGVFLAQVHERLERINTINTIGVRLPYGSRTPIVKPGKILGLSFFIIVFIVSHYLFYHMSDIDIHLKTPTLVYLNRPSIWHHPRVFAMKEKKRIIELIKENVAPDEFFYLHASYYFNNYAAANSRRSAFIPVGVDYKSQGIKLIVERFNAPSDEYSFLEKVNEEFDFSAYVLKDSTKPAKVKISKPLVTIKQLQIAFMVMGALVLI
ncbi:MAG: hypothetical protein KKD29_04685, partial [Candidatus Omnitrophica bacterium]|nr:hypothetical protein [Candidatus Omnitrophota bacterium]